MTVTNIESRVTQSAFAWEQQRGQEAVPLSEWRILDLNSYSDGGVKFENTTRSVMNGSRRQKKGAQTSKTATFGYNIDNTINNTAAQVAAFMYGVPSEQPCTRSIVHGAPIGGLPQGIALTNITATGVTIDVMIANQLAVNDIIMVEDGTNDRSAQVITEIDTKAGALTLKPVNGGIALVPPRIITLTALVRRVGVVLPDSSSLVMTTDGSSVTLTAGSNVFDTKGLTLGQWVYIGHDGSISTTSNDQGTFGRIVGISPTVLTLDTTTYAIGTSDVPLAGREVYFGTFITDGDKMLSMTHTRYLGVNSAGNHMRENTVGCMPNEMTINAKEKSLQTIDFTFMAMDAIYRELAPAENAPYNIDLIPAPATDPVNMAFDVVRQRLTVPKVGKMNTAAIHSFVKESTIAIKNNLQENTANGSIGIIGASVGEFSATGTIKAYFNDLAALNAVRCNCNVALDWTFARKQQGFIIDMPSLQLAADGISIEKNQSVQIDLTQTAFESSQFGYVLSYNIFHYLPKSAMPADTCDC